MKEIILDKWEKRRAKNSQKNDEKNSEILFEKSEAIFRSKKCEKNEWRNWG